MGSWSITKGVDGGEDRERESSQIVKSKECCAHKEHEFYSVDSGDLMKCFRTKGNIYKIITCRK